MNKVLIQNNNDLLDEIAVIKEQINKTPIPVELESYQNWLTSILEDFKKQVEENLVLVSISDGLLIPEIISRTHIITTHLRSLSGRFIDPIIRYNKSDLFCLKIIHWLHKKHKENPPFAISDGNFAIYPMSDGPAIYFLPFSSLENLRHIPLIFHEFGHYLYAIHKPEMDALVKELQDAIWKEYKPSYTGNSQKDKKEVERLKGMIETWYEWTQEFFCDAVGLHICGISYLKTFSIYLRMMGRGQYKLPKEELMNSSHPVSWLRVKFLVKRAKDYGIEDGAEDVMNEWNEIAKELGVKREDYFGFYESAFENIVYNTLSDMLVETDPIYFQDYLEDSEEDNIIKWIKKAWELYDANNPNYNDWQSMIVDKFTREKVYT